jgi:hypothetical protein
MKLKGRMPSPGTAIALVALFAALGGTAVALEGRNSVRSDDIKNGQVRKPDIRKRAVDASRTDLTKVNGEAGEATTTSNSPVALSGPQVKVNVPKGGLVAIFAQVEGRVTGGGGNLANVYLHEAEFMPSPERLMTFDSAGFQTRQTAPDSGPTGGDGAAARARGGWIVLAPPPGKSVFSLRYEATGGTGIFRDRKLWVTVLG